MCACVQKIVDLIKVLDRKKDEAIERTFKGVARHFGQVFTELVPDGKGLLVMQRSKEGESGVAGYTGPPSTGALTFF